MEGTIVKKILSFAVIALAFAAFVGAQEAAGVTNPAPEAAPVSYNFV